MPTKAEDIRVDVVNGVDPFAGRPELRVTDPAFVDPIIAQTIQGGGRDRADIVWKAQNALKRKLAEPDGLSQIDKLIAAHYANPEITTDGTVVTVDVGVVEGKVSVSSRGKPYLTNDSPYLDNGRWRPSELAKFLKLGIAKHPGAAEYHVNCLIPEPMGTRPDWKYAYFPKAGIIKIARPDFRGAAYVLKNVSPDLSTLTSLSASDFQNE